MEMYEKVDNHPHGLTFEKWREILKRMVHLLAIMDIWDDSALRQELGIPEEDKSDHVSVRLNEKRMDAKEEFFSLFNKFFFDLWY